MANENKEKQKPLEEIEILTCSAADYAVMMGRNLRVYTPMWIDSKSSSDDKKALRERAREKGCVAVVDIRPVRYGNSGYYFIGTGLKIKTEDEEA
jgi:hypothetical protein